MSVQDKCTCSLESEIVMYSQLQTNVIVYTKAHLLATLEDSESPASVWKGWTAIWVIEGTGAPGKETAVAAMEGVVTV